MKKYLLLLFCLVSSLMASAESGTCGDNLTWTLEDGILVISGTGAMKNYYSKSSVPWYSSRSTVSLAIISEGVTSIGSSAFRDCSGLTSVTIPNSVTSIGASAFYGCSGLTSITIPNSVTSIGASAFRDCTGLTSVTIPNSVTSIGEYAFRDCSGLTSVTIPDGVTSIGNYAFYKCSGLTSVTIPNSVTSMGNYAFEDCSGLITVNVSCKDMEDFGNYVQRTDIYFVFHSSELIAKLHNIYIAGELQTNITIPNSVTSIGDHAFYNCSGLTFTIPNSVTSIGEWAFSDCSRLTSITIPNSVTSIGEFAFQYCDGLTSVTIPNSVTSIGAGAFWDCRGLTSITIPNSVTSIGGSAFSGCRGLTSITIPNSVTSIGGSAFKDCYMVASNFINNSICSDSENWGITLCDEETVDGLLVKDNIVVSCRIWTTSVTIPNSVTSLGNKAFMYCSGLTSITIPNSVTSIGNYAFYGCSGLTSITIPNSVTSIGDVAFDGCSFTSITIPNSVTSIGDYAFCYCRDLTSITIPNSVTSIGNKAFYNCSGLTSVNVLATIPPTCGSNLLEDAGTSTIHVYKGFADAYKAASGWSSYIIVDDIPVVHVTGITLDATIYQCGIGQRFTPQVVTYEPEDATFKEVTWSSSDPSILTIVPSTGACIGMKDGIVTITATAKDSGHVTATATVYVGNTVPEGINNISVSPSDCTYYNLQGQRKAHTGKGLYIQHGKKMLVH